MRYRRRGIKGHPRILPVRSFSERKCDDRIGVRPATDQEPCRLHEGFVHPADLYDLNPAEVAYAQVVFPVSLGDVDGRHIEGPVLTESGDPLETEDLRAYRVDRDGIGPYDDPLVGPDIAPVERSLPPVRRIGVSGRQGR